MMSEDLEMKTEGQSTEQKPTEGSREGYRSASNYASNRPVGRTPRPRIHGHGNVSEFFIMKEKHLGNGKLKSLL